MRHLQPKCPPVIQRLGSPPVVPSACSGRHQPRQPKCPPVIQRLGSPPVVPSACSGRHQPRPRMHACLISVPRGQGTACTADITSRQSPVQPTARPPMPDVSTDHMGDAGCASYPIVPHYTARPRLGAQVRVPDVLGRQQTLGVHTVVLRHTHGTLPRPAGSLATAYSLRSQHVAALVSGPSWPCWCWVVAAGPTKSTGCGCTLASPVGQQVRPMLALLH